MYENLSQRSLEIKGQEQANGPEMFFSISGPSLFPYHADTAFLEMPKSHTFLTLLEVLHAALKNLHILITENIDCHSLSYSLRVRHLT